MKAWEIVLTLVDSRLQATEMLRNSTLESTDIQNLNGGQYWF